MQTPTAVAGTGAPLNGALNGPLAANQGWGPTAIANALEFPVQSGFNGAGSTIAVIIDSTINTSDVEQYLAYFSVPSTNQVTVSLLSGASSTPLPDSSEATLDVETIAGLAPGAKILLYVMPALTTANFNNALEAVQQAGQADIISYSIDGCEGASTSATSGIIAALRSKIAIVAASGDTGTACFDGTNGTGANRYLPGVQYPASDPNVIGVGGTQTFSSAGPTTLTSTVAWNDTLMRGGGEEASGGGISSTFGLPAYQAGVAGIGSSIKRNVPDISMPAAESAVFVNGQWQADNGTSWAAPQFAAMLAEIYEYCRVTSFSNPAALPYAAFSSAGYAGFIDAVSGNNAYGPLGDPGLSYAAGPGYDNVTGIGVPLGMPMASALCPNRVPSSATRAVSVTARATDVRAMASTQNVTPGVVGLADLGRRSAGEATAIQLVLSSSGSASGNERAAIEALRSAGFTIGQTFSNHLVVNASGPSRAVESLFSTEIHDVSQAASASEYMPTTDITVPVSLAPYVAGVVLDNVVTFASRHR